MLVALVTGDHKIRIEIVTGRSLHMIHQPNGCWIYDGTINDKGYGVVTRHGKVMPANRLALILTIGPLPRHTYSCYHCDNPPCCNPDHLFPGTAENNALDASRKGRLARKPHPSPATVIHVASA